MVKTTGGATTFHGGFNVRCRSRWVSRHREEVRWPLAALVVTPGTLALRYAWPLSWLPGGRTASRAEVVACFLVHPTTHGTRGVGFELPEHEIAYFWTPRPEPVLSTLEAYGYPVTAPRWARYAHVLRQAP